MLSYLGVTFGTLVAAYLLLVTGTVYLASWQSDLLSQVADKEASIGQLEAEYYSSIAAVNSMDTASLGFVVPTAKTYARAAEAPALTRADY
jgi:hypothetical protein